MSDGYDIGPEGGGSATDSGAGSFSFEGRGRPSAKVPLTGIAVAVLLVGAGAFAAWRMIVTSPQYSLGKAREAIEAGDATQAKRYVDAGMIADDLVDGSIKTLAADAGSPAAAAALTGLADLARPLFEGSVSDKVMEQVMALTPQSPPPLSALSGSCSVERTGNAATASFTGEAGERLVLKLAYTGEYWRVVGLGNAAEVASAIMPDLSWTLKQYAGQLPTP